MKTRDETLVEAIERAKKSQFGLTSVKVELEALFFRRETASDFCENGDCEDGRVECECDDGLALCENCGGAGCHECDSDGQVVCDICGGDGWVRCADCSDVNSDWQNMHFIHDKVLEKLAPLGLSEKLRPNETSAYSDKYKPKRPLVFSKVYPDGTVDTEMTFTLLLDDPRAALLLPKFLEAFYSLKDGIGQGVDVGNAGMHISLLNSEDGVYPISTMPSDMRRFSNFKRSLILLLPALYFLASSNPKSRSLGYRQPVVGCQDLGDTHRSAVNYTGGALEFRIFDTCYETPEAVLDNLMVALNCLRFWTTKYTRNHLDKVTKKVRFGIREGDELKRLFVTTEHIELLNQGLRMIKPSWYTISQVKAQRDFTTTKRHVKGVEVQARIKAEAEYRLYEKRYGWDQVMRKHSYIRNYIEQNLPIEDMPEPSDQTLLDKAEQYAQEELNRSQKKPLEEFCTEVMPELTKAGDYLLCAE